MRFDPSCPYRLLATDLDNTLIPFGDPTPTPRMRQMLTALREAGVPLAVATGRSFRSMAGKLNGQIPFDYAVCCNGGLITDSAGRVLAESPLTAEEMYALVDFFEDYSYPLAFAFPDNYYAYTEYETLKRVFSYLPGAMLTLLDGEDQDRHLQGMPHAAFGILPVGELEHFQSRYGHLGIAFRALGGEENGLIRYDIMGRGVDKTGGLVALCKVLGIPPEAMVTAGDGHNDCDMLAGPGLGCAMANGCEAAKQAADRVIGDVRRDGLADLIEELWFFGPPAVPGEPLPPIDHV